MHIAIAGNIGAGKTTSNQIISEDITVGNLITNLLMKILI